MLKHFKEYWLLYLFMILILACTVLVVGDITNIIPTWDETATKKCHEQYGVNAQHPSGQSYCILKNGEIKGIRE